MKALGSLIAKLPKFLLYLPFPHNVASENQNVM